MRHMYRIFYRCQMCGVRFWEDVHRDTITSAMECFQTDMTDLFDDKRFLVGLFQHGGELHKCEMDTVGHGKVIGIRKLSDKDVI